MRGHSIAIDIQEIEQGQRQIQASQTQLESDLQGRNKKLQRLERTFECFEQLNQTIRALMNTDKTSGN